MIYSFFCWTIIILFHLLILSFFPTFYFFKDSYDQDLSSLEHSGGIISFILFYIFFSVCLIYIQVLLSRSNNQFRIGFEIQDSQIRNWLLNSVSKIFVYWHCIFIRVRPRFFDQVGHETMHASSENKHIFSKSCHRQTYQNYEQSRQKFGTFLVDKLFFKNQSFQKISLK